MIYSSTNNAKIKDIKKLNNKKFRDQLGLFLVEGEHLIDEAYQMNCLACIVILEGYDLDYQVDKLYVTDSVMKYISDLNTPPKYIGICKKLNNNYIGNKVIMLDNIQDPGNLGTIIRSCVAFDCDTLIISADSVDIYNPKVIRATQGMIFKLNIIVCDLEKRLVELRENGYSVYGTDVVNGVDVCQLEKMDKYVIIMGNEGQGMSNKVKKLCDKFIYININNNCESLNVGVATSIILYELNKR